MFKYLLNKIRILIHICHSVTGKYENEKSTHYITRIMNLLACEAIGHSVVTIQVKIFVRQETVEL